MDPAKVYLRKDDVGMASEEDLDDFGSIETTGAHFPAYSMFMDAAATGIQMEGKHTTLGNSNTVVNARSASLETCFNVDLGRSNSGASNSSNCPIVQKYTGDEFGRVIGQNVKETSLSGGSHFPGFEDVFMQDALVLDKGFNQEGIIEYQEGVAVLGNEQLDAGSFPVKGEELKAISDSDTVKNSKAQLHEDTRKMECMSDRLDGQWGSVSMKSGAADVLESNKSDLSSIERNISDDANHHEPSDVDIGNIQDGILHDYKSHHDTCAEEQGEDGVAHGSLGLSSRGTLNNRIASESSSLENVVNAEVIPVHMSLAEAIEVVQGEKGAYSTDQQIAVPAKSPDIILQEIDKDDERLERKIGEQVVARSRAPQSSPNIKQVESGKSVEASNSSEGMSIDALGINRKLELSEREKDIGECCSEQQTRVLGRSPDSISGVDKVHKELENMVGEQDPTRSATFDSILVVQQLKGRSNVQERVSGEDISGDVHAVKEKLGLIEGDQNLNGTFILAEEIGIAGRSPHRISAANASGQNIKFLGEQKMQESLEPTLVDIHATYKIERELDGKGVFSGEEQIQVPDRSVCMFSPNAHGTNVKLQEMRRKQDRMRGSLPFEGQKGVKENLSEQAILSTSGPAISQLTLLNHDGVEAISGFEEYCVSEIAGVNESKQLTRVLESSTDEHVEVGDASNFDRASVVTSFITVEASNLCNTSCRDSNSTSVLDGHDDLTKKEKLELVGGQHVAKDGSSGEDQLEAPDKSPGSILEVYRMEVNVGQSATRGKDLKSAAVFEQFDSKKSVGESVSEVTLVSSAAAEPLLEFGVHCLSDNTEITRDNWILSVEGGNVLDVIDDVKQSSHSLDEEEKLLSDGQLGDEKQRAEMKMEGSLGIRDEKQASVGDEGSLLKNGSFTVVSTTDEVKQLKNVVKIDPGQTYEAEGRTLSNDLAAGDFKHLQFTELAASSGNTIAGHSCDTEIDGESDQAFEEERERGVLDIYTRQGPDFEQDTFSTHSRHENEVLGRMVPLEGVEGTLMQDVEVGCFSVAVGGYDARVEVPVFNKMEESDNLSHFTRDNNASSQLECNCEQDHFAGHVLAESLHGLSVENVEVSAAEEVASGKEVSGIADFCTKQSEADIAVTYVGNSSWTKEETSHPSNAKGFKASKMKKQCYAHSLAISGKDGNGALREKQHCIEGIAKVENFNVGDLVWAKVKSHPWWPGMVFNAADASVYAKKLQVSGRILVAFFADHTFAWLNCSQIVPFELNFSMKVNQTNMKIFCSAVAEALDEVCRRAELGMRCLHLHGDLHSKVEFPDTNAGIQKGVQIVQHRDITQSRNNFEPAKTLEFIKSVACTPLSPCNFTPETANLLGHAYSLQTGMSALEQIQGDELLKNMFINIKGGKMKRKFYSVGASEYMTGTKKICGLKVTGSGKYLTAKSIKDARKAKTDKDVSGKMAFDAAEDSKASNRLFKRNHAATSGVKMGRSNSESASLRRSLAENEYEVKKRLKTWHMSSTGTKHPKVKGEEDKHAHSDEDSETVIALPAGSKSRKIIKKGKIQNVKLQKSDFNAKAEVKDLEFGFDENAYLEDSRALGEESQQYKLDGDKLSARLVEETKLGPSLQSAVRRPVKGDKLGGDIAMKSSEEGSPRKAVSAICFKEGLQKTKVPVGSGLLTKKFLDGIPDSTITRLFQHFLFLAKNPHSITDSKGSLAATRAAFIKLRERTFLSYDTTFPLVDCAIEGTHFVSEEKRQSTETGSVGVDQQPGASNAVVKKPPRQELTTKAMRQKSTELEKLMLSTERHRNMKPEMAMHRSAGRRNHPRVGDDTGNKSWKKATDVVDIQDMGRKKGGGMAQAPFNSKKGREDKVSLGPPFGLFMKFPRNITLPSEAQLKATFVRFGPLESSQTRVFKNTASAVVVFKNRRDAEAALKHAREKKIFGKDAFVAYRVREFLKRPDLKQDASQTDKGKLPSRMERGVTAQRSGGRCVQGEAKEEQGRSSSLVAGVGLCKESTRTLDSNSRPSILEPTGDIQDKMMKLLQQVGVICGGSSSPVGLDHTSALTPKG